MLDRLVPKLDLDEVPLDKLGDEDLWQKAESAIVDMVETLDSSGELPKFVDQDQLIKDTLNEALGLGPLEDLLADEKVDEIVVDRRDRILVGKRRRGQPGVGTAFSSDDALPARGRAPGRADRAGHRRQPPAGRRPPARRLAPGRGGPAGRGARRLPHPAQAEERRAEPGRPGRRRRAVAGDGRLPVHLRRGPPQHRGVRRARLGQERGARARSRRPRPRASASSASRRSPSCRSAARTGSRSRRARPTATAPRRSTSACSCAARCACGRIAWWSATCAAPRRSS